MIFILILINIKQLTPTCKLAQVSEGKEANWVVAHVHHSFCLLLKMNYYPTE